MLLPGAEPVAAHELGFNSRGGRATNAERAFLGRTDVQVLIALPPTGRMA